MHLHDGCDHAKSPKYRLLHDLYTVVFTMDDPSTLDEELCF